ncbi:MAG: hypothetical protein LLG40_10605 [Deltaproteobacteria bacterium]|nr:hypothetical protein [Deltaproteobacteria bacterium]
MFWNLFKKRIKKEVDNAVSENMNIQFLKNMQKLEVKDGDIVVMKSPYKLSQSVADNLRAAVQELIKDYGFNVHVMVLEQDMEIGILTKEK